MALFITIFGHTDVRTILIKCLKHVNFLELLRQRRLRKRRSIWRLSTSWSLQFLRTSFCGIRVLWIFALELFHSAKRQRPLFSYFIVPNHFSKKTWNAFCKQIFLYLHTHFFILTSALHVETIQFHKLKKEFFANERKKFCDNFLLKTKNLLTPFFIFLSYTENNRYHEQQGL